VRVKSPVPPPKKKKKKKKNPGTVALAWDPSYMGDKGKRI
jgi:hypothetical protein